MDNRRYVENATQSPFPGLNEIADIVGGCVVFSAEEEQIGSVSIDSRNCTKGSLFFALVGEHADGEGYVASAAKAGAVAAVVRHERSPEGALWPIPVVVVSEPLIGLHRLARWYVDTYLSGTVRIGVTGSNGKTTTKEFIATLLERSGSVYFSKGNYNSETGLPLSILETPGTVDFGVYEMAMSAPGEMEALSDIVRPHIAMITNIGTAHIGRVGSRDAIAREKKMIASRFTGSEILILPEDDVYREFLSDGVAGTVTSFGPKTQNARIVPGNDGNIRLSFSAGPTIDLPVPGRHNGLNALAALRLAEIATGEAGIPTDLSWTRNLPSGRAERKILPDGGLLIHDAYNANPDSMAASLEMVAELREQSEANLVIVLGDMYELGPVTPTAHEEILIQALQLRPASLFLIGKEFSNALERVKQEDLRDVRVTVASKASELSGADLASVSGHVLVLLKGSRAVGLETLIPRLTGALSVEEVV